MMCRDCTYIDALLATIKAPDQLVMSVREHLRELHKSADAGPISYDDYLELVKKEIMRSKEDV